MGLKEKFLSVFKLKDIELATNPIFLKYKDRLDHEIKIIVKMNYSSYFLIVCRLH